MDNIKISVNQLVDFGTATEARKRRIILDQKTPDNFKVAWYQLARASMKRSIAQRCDNMPIIEGINRLKSRIISKPRQIQDKAVSLEAMRRFLKIKLSPLFKNHNYTIIKEKEKKSTLINGVEVIVSPDVIFKILIDNQYYIGAVKLHISKNNIFSSIKSSYVSTIIFKYLKEISANYDAKVLPELCLSIDVFGEKATSTPKNLNTSLKSIEKLCKEVKQMWRRI